MKPRKARTPKQGQAKKLRKKVEPQEPMLDHCPYCLNWHTAGTVPYCPLNPNRLNRSINGTGLWQ